MRDVAETTQEAQLSSLHDVAYLRVEQRERKLEHIIAVGCWLSRCVRACGAWCRQASELLCRPASRSTQATFSQVQYGHSELSAPLTLIAHSREPIKYASLGGWARWGSYLAL